MSLLNMKNIQNAPDVENVFNERHDIDATHETIEQMLAGGTPNWVKWPHEYRAYAREAFAAEKERSDKMGLEYRWYDQAVLTDRAARKVNGIGTRDFIEKKLRANGVKCAVTASDWVGPGGIRTVALWATPPRRTDKLRFVGSLDVPMMWEWSVLHLDHHNIPSGRESIGWRDIAVQLVQKEIISEAQCHKIFGAPPLTLFPRDTTAPFGRHVTGNRTKTRKIGRPRETRTLSVHLPDPGYKQGAEDVLPAQGVP